jgi:hypothetical protein
MMLLLIVTAWRQGLLACPHQTLSAVLCCERQARQANVTLRNTTCTCIDKTCSNVFNTVIAESEI